MNKILLTALLLFAFLYSGSLFSQGTDSTSAFVKLSLRYILNTDEEKKTSQTVKSEEVGNMPVSMNFNFAVSPFLWMKAPLKGVFIIQDSRFHQDRTSSEFGLGYAFGKTKIYGSYGFRLIRKKEGGARGFSSSFEKKDTKSIGVSSEFEILDIESSFDGKISYDGYGKFFYCAEVRLFLPSKESSFYLLGFHESFFGTGSYVVFRSRNLATDVFFGYIFPESQSERKYKRTEGIVMGFTHTWW